MTIKDLLDDLDDEIKIIQDSSFDINMTETLTAPTYADPSLTFENFDDHCKSVKTIETCVLYADIRKSTKLNIQYHSKIIYWLKIYLIRMRTQFI